MFAGPPGVVSSISGPYMDPMSGRIVTFAHRYKRRPRKKNAVPLHVPAVVRRAAKPPADATAPPVTGGRKSAIVTAASKHNRAIPRREEADDGQEASPEIKAFFARMMRWPNA